MAATGPADPMAVMQEMERQIGVLQGQVLQLSASLDTARQDTQLVREAAGRSHDKLQEEVTKQLQNGGGRKLKLFDLRAANIKTFNNDRSTFKAFARQVRALCDNERPGMSCIGEGRTCEGDDRR